MTPPSSPEPAGTGASDQAFIETVVTCLEMTAPPARPRRPPPVAGLEVRHAPAPDVAFYRALYEAVGHPWHWTERTLLSDDALRAIIADPRVEVHVLHAEGAPAGYVELDGRRPPDVQIAYFGLLPAFIGRGFGGFLLDWAIGHAFRGRPRRLWVHTCDLDHPSALPVYQKAGFRVYRTRTERVPRPVDAAARGAGRGTRS